MYFVSALDRLNDCLLGTNNKVEKMTYLNIFFPFIDTLRNNLVIRKSKS